MDDPSAFFRQQTVFLTGGTGYLGACLLYQLATKLDTRKIYLLVRGSPEQAISQWKKTIPTQIEAILATEKVQLVVGDVTEPNFGFHSATLDEMADTVTIIIHGAASLNWMSSLRETVHNNCLPVLHLAKIASIFKNLTRFIFISTIYASSHLPDRVVEEKVYPAGDAEEHLAQILKEGKVAGGVDGRFASRYAFVKNMTEQLLLARYPKLPILIARPGCIGPAISEPYPYYARGGACPLSDYIERYMQNPDSGIFHVSSLHPAGTNIVDEVPVDTVANLILLHVMHGTAGVIHTSAESYVPRTLAQLHQDVVDHFPKQHGSRGAEFRYVTDDSVKQGRYAEFWGIGGRDWRFSNAASKRFRSVDGPLSVALGDHDSRQFMKERARRIGEEIIRRRASRVSSKL
ncbi:NAD-binding domain 4 protein [Favolaschia claudopus]|uniref:Fatty acyl-CoA reductase n=1 Tax=Favolaschia claudopus TaxID=2862362 RepID=A0AAW0BC20_9AGAR